MITRDNHGTIIGEINISRASDGRIVTTQTSYLNGQVALQNVPVRDSQGHVETTHPCAGWKNTALIGSATRGGKRSGPHQKRMARSRKDRLQSSFHGIKAGSHSCFIQFMNRSGKSF